MITASILHTLTELGTTSEKLVVTLLFVCPSINVNADLLTATPQLMENLTFQFRDSEISGSRFLPNTNRKLRDL